MATCLAPCGTRKMTGQSYADRRREALEILRDVARDDEGRPRSTRAAIHAPTTMPRNSEIASVMV